MQCIDSVDAEYGLVIAQQTTVDVELRKAKIIAPFHGVVIDRMTDETAAILNSSLYRSSAIAPSSVNSLYS